MIRILTTNYNTSAYIHRFIYSLQSQSVKEWKCYITDDMSTDGSQPYIQSLISGDDRFELIENIKKFWQTGNYYQVLQKEEIDDNDIVITVDGDDWLPDDGVFQRVLDYYSDGNTWITFGQFMHYQGENNYKKGFSRKPQPFSEVRRLPWTSSHLRTFKAFLFRKIKYEDLLDDNGYFYKTAGDVVCITPMLEMAGEERVKYVDDINYVYNVETELNEYKTKLSDQIRVTKKIAEKAKYERI